jgi:hypothetical protein
VKIIIFLILCAFFVIPLLLLNQDDGPKSVILSTIPAKPVIQPTASARRQQSARPGKTAQDEDCERRHMLLFTVLEGLRK